MILAIDPSTLSTGVALFDGINILACGCVSATDDKSHKLGYLERALLMVDSIAAWMPYDQGEITVVVETPAHWASARGSDSEASESVQKLYWMVGALIERLIGLSIVDTVYSVHPTDWKGHVPKTVMVERSKAWLLSKNRYTEAEREDMPHDTHEAITLARWFAFHLSKQLPDTVKRLKPCMGTASTMVRWW